jgi:hypothetical protein
MKGCKLSLCCTIVGVGDMMMIRRTGTIREAGKLIVCCTDVDEGVMVLDSRTGSVIENGKWIVY